MVRPSMYSKHMDSKIIGKMVLNSLFTVPVGMEIRIIYEWLFLREDYFRVTESHQNKNSSIV